VSRGASSLHGTSHLACALLQEARALMYRGLDTLRS